MRRGPGQGGPVPGTLLPMASWEQRAQKLESRRSRMQKHGRGILTAISAAERRREKQLRERAAKRARRAR